MSKVNGIRTSRGIAKIASKTLRNGATNHNTKKIAGSALSNRARKSH